MIIMSYVCLILIIDYYICIICINYCIICYVIDIVIYIGIIFNMKYKYLYFTPVGAGEIV